MNAAEFDENVKAEKLSLAFVGMSNVGKTSRARALENTSGFLRIEVDDLIMQELQLREMNALASWLGYPDSDGYQEREHQYLGLEERLTTQELHTDKNIILDTTGSVVHLPEKAQQRLREKYVVVHFDAGEEAMEQLIERYFSHPKPVIWGPFFASNPGETTKQTLTRCYPALLHERLARFRRLAHINIKSSSVPLEDGKAILDAIRSCL